MRQLYSYYTSFVLVYQPFDLKFMQNTLKDTLFIKRKTIAQKT